MHTLICGVTESGKTTLAHLLAAEDARQKKEVIVFDPVGTQTAAGEWPDHVVMFTDKQKFLRYVARPTNPEGTAVYIDEAADILSHDQRENEWLLTRGRHLGYSVTLVTQRPKLVSPSVRHQCARLFMFRLSQGDAREIGADYGHSGFDKISLDQGDFLCVFSGRAKFTRANVFALINNRKGVKDYGTLPEVGTRDGHHSGNRVPR
jgi:DNA helicase HerA-like ATPase